MSENRLNRKGIVHLQKVVQIANLMGYAFYYKGVIIVAWDFQSQWIEKGDGTSMRMSDINPHFLYQHQHVFDRMQKGFFK